MADSEFRFVLVDGGTEGPAPQPGSAAQSASRSAPPGGGRAEPRAAPGEQVAGRRHPDRPLADAVRDMVKRLSDLPLLAKPAAAGLSATAGIFGIERFIRSLRDQGRQQGERRQRRTPAPDLPRAQPVTPTAFRVRRATFDGPHRAVFHVRSGKIVIPQDSIREILGRLSELPKSAAAGAAASAGVDRFRRGRDGEKPDRKVGLPDLPRPEPVSPQPFRVQRATFEGPEQAVFQVRAGKFVIHGGEYFFADGRSGPFPGAQRGQPRLPGPSRGPAPEAPRPRLPAPSPARLPSAGRAAAGAAEAAPAAAEGAAAAGAAEAGAALGGLSAGAIAAATGLGLLVVAVGAAVAAMTALWRRANRQAEELQAFSPALAQAQAQARLTRLQGQMASAAKLGDTLAELVEVQTQMGVATRRILDVLEKEFLDAILPLLRFIADTLEVIAAGVEIAEAIKDILVEFARGQIGVAELLPELRTRIAEIVANTDPSKQRGDLLDLFRAIPDLPIDGPSGVPGLPAETVEWAAPGFGTFHNPPE